MYDGVAEGQKSMDLTEKRKNTLSDKNYHNTINDCQYKRATEERYYYEKENVRSPINYNNFDIRKA